MAFQKSLLYFEILALRYFYVDCDKIIYNSWVLNVINREEEKNTLTLLDNEMDERAVEAVKAAINKAKICKKPIASYDKEKKRAYN